MYDVIFKVSSHFAFLANKEDLFRLSTRVGGWGSDSPRHTQFSLSFFSASIYCLNNVRDATFISCLWLFSETYFYFRPFNLFLAEGCLIIGQVLCVCIYGFSDTRSNNHS
jgi:hypothetical protein